MDCGTGNKAATGTGDGYELSNLGGAQDPPSTQSAEGVGDDNRPLDALWRLLMDAGYEVW